MKIFNHDIRGMAPTKFNLSWLYCSRALCLTEADDVIQLPIELREHWPFIYKHYQDIGLHCCSKVIWDLNLANLANLVKPPDFELSSFYFGEQENKLHPDEKRFQITTQLNSKNRFIELAQQNNILVPKTIWANNLMDLHLNSEDFPGPVYFKPAVSTSGLGIFRFQNIAALQSNLHKLANWGPFQIQEEVLADVFLSIQYQVKQGKARRLLVSDQQLQGFSHSGNICPSRFLDVDVLDDFAQQLANEGMKDIFGFDLAVKSTGQVPQFITLECNPRFTAASYPTLLAEKLNVKNWRSINIKTSDQDFDSVQIHDLEYQPFSDSGIIIINWGTIVHKNLMLMIIGDEDEQKQLCAEAISRFGD